MPFMGSTVLRANEPYSSSGTTVKPAISPEKIVVAGRRGIDASVVGLVVGEPGPSLVREKM